MRRFVTILRDRFRRARRSEEGASTIEFVIIFPAFIFLVCSSIETGFLALRQVMFERALDLTVRDLRLGLLVDPSHDDLKQSICSKSPMVPQCINSLRIQLTPIDRVAFTPLGAGAFCADRSLAVQPVVDPLDVVGGVENDLMMIRACAGYDPFFVLASIGMQLPVDANGDYNIVSTSVFVNEPS